MHFFRKIVYGTKYKVPLAEIVTILMVTTYLYIKVAM